MCKGGTIPDVIKQLQDVTKNMLSWFESNYMHANPDKFQFVVHCKTPLPCSIALGEHNIKPEASVKLLGVNIDDQLSFNGHISILCKKAGKQLNALLRLSRVLSQEAKYKLFDTFILSCFNFCPIVWHFCSDECTRMIENMQKRALRYVFNDFNSAFGELRNLANKPLLYVQRLRCIVLEVFKIYKNIGPTYMHDFIEERNTNVITRQVNHVNIPSFRSVKYGRNSFKYQGAILWNALPNEYKQCISVKDLKSLLNAWDGPVCSCSCCKLCKLNYM